MEARQEKNQAIEYNLFYGAPQENILKICDVGFSFDNYDTKGFSCDASYVHRSVSNFRDQLDSSMTFYMLLVKVLVGTYNKNNNNNNNYLPDIKSEACSPDGISYDSLVDDLKNPSVFEIFENQRALPHYIIEYSVNNRINFE